MSDTPKTKKALIVLENITPESIKTIQGVEVEIRKVIEENPFVEVTDNKSLEKAKKAANALLTVSTKWEKADKDAASYLSRLRKGIGEILTGEKGTVLSREKYVAQKAPIDAWEKQKQAEKEEKERLEKEADDRIKQSITDLIDGYKKQIEELEYSKIKAVTDAINESIKTHTGTFDKFDILFDRDAENVVSSFEIKTKAVTDAHNQAEENRKNAHLQAINKIDLEVKDIVLKMTYASMVTDSAKISVLIGTEQSFEEFAGQWKEKVQELNDLTLKTTTKLTADFDQQEELRILREKNTYNDRSKLLIAIGMTAQENGDLIVKDLGYKKSDIISDSQEVFDQTYENIERFIKAEANKTATEEVAEELAPAVEETPAPIANDLQINEMEEVGADNNSDLDTSGAFQGAVAVLESEVTTALGIPTTTGELIDFLSSYPRETGFGFIKQFPQMLFEIKNNEELIVGFGEVTIEQVIEKK